MKKWRVALAATGKKKNGHGKRVPPLKKKGGRTPQGRPSKK